MDRINKSTDRPIRPAVFHTNRPLRNPPGSKQLDEIQQVEKGQHWPLSSFSDEQLATESTNARPPDPIYLVARHHNMLPPIVITESLLKYFPIFHSKKMKI